TVWEGYSQRGPSKISQEEEEEIFASLKNLFPTGNQNLDYEIARAFGMVRSDDPEILESLTRLVVSDLHPCDDIHYLAVLGRIEGPRSATQTARIATSLLMLDYKIESRGMNRDRHWPQRIGEIYTALAEKDSNLNTALVESPKFGMPGHIVFVSTPGSPVEQVAGRLETLSRSNPNFKWSTGWIDLLKNLPAEKADPLLQELSEQGAFRDTVIRILANRPTERDRSLFYQGLSSWNRTTVDASIQALSQLTPPEGLEEWSALLGAMERFGKEVETQETERKIAAYLTRVLGGDQEPSDSTDWVALLAGVDPEIASGWKERRSKTLGDWTKRLAQIDWDSGDPNAGHEVYERVGCADCHTGSRSLGPDLHGVTQRFGHEDLMTAILDPSRDVPSRYRALTIETKDGDFVQGLVVYKAVDSVILQNGPDSTLRVEGPDILSEYTSETSIMPTGLLDTLTDQEVANLYAYLKTLQGEGSL
ncbi:MAG: c-type cytochrome, partial [Candidatus Omnitrophica bacterium]|nr:c-type cytochrome [Candidatus Omnitrophota bacterium]